MTVNSPIIRLEDVVRPLDPNMAGWQRLRRSPIGLVPIGGQPMTIHRDRLAQAIHDAEATPLAIDWIGPTEIKVLYRELDEAEMRQRAIGVCRDRPNRLRRISCPLEAKSRQRSPADRCRLSDADAKRAIYWIELAIERLLPSIAENYRIDIDRRQSGLSPLRWISGVTAVEPREKIHEGRCRFHLVGRSVDGVGRNGDRYHADRTSDGRCAREEAFRVATGSSRMIWNSNQFPKKNSTQASSIDPEELIGLEVRGIVRANRPIIRGDVGSPILVHRGDLIEVRVVGGGITVTTNAKSLGEGAASELIEIETMQPRKRLVARVVQPGLVEIVTRAPRVSR